MNYRFIATDANARDMKVVGECLSCSASKAVKVLQSA